MDDLEIEKLLNVDETIATDLFKVHIYPWEILPEIKNFIEKIGLNLDKDKFNKIGNNIWIAKSAKVAPTACIIGPTIIDEEAEIRHSAFIRGSVIIGKNAVIGNSSEIKNAIIFNKAQVPHYNYVGDSIVGYKAHMGASSILSNVRADKNNVTIKVDSEKIQTGLRKFGAILGDGAEIGCGAIINPGSIISKSSIVRPLTSVSGFIKN